MNLSRMRLLDDVLTDVIEGRAKLGFDMGTWHCGTTACAGGHLALDPRANAEGLSLTSHLDWGLVPTFDGAHGYSPLAVFLEITTNQSERLFSSYNYRRRKDGSISPQAVRRRVRAMIKRATP